MQAPVAEEKKDSFFGSAFESKNPQDTTAENIASKQLVGLFFSASWCPPCKAFLPILTEFYKEINFDTPENPQFDVIFMSHDQDEGKMKEYFEKMPWRAIKWMDERYHKFKGMYSVTGIPKLIIVTPEGAEITREGRTDVVEKGEEAWLEWMKIKQQLVDSGRNVPPVLQPGQVGTSAISGNPSNFSKLK